MQIVREKLCDRPQQTWRALLETSTADPDSADINATWRNGKQGPNPILSYRASRLLTSQVPTRVPATSAAGQAVHRAAEQVLAALQGVFHLDPVPHLMRQYVQEKDIVLRRNAENLSATVRHLSTTDVSASEELFTLLQTLPEHDVTRLRVERSGLGDVMLAVEETQDRHAVVIPARLMSDGMLRFLAIATALLSSGEPESAASADARGGRTLVIEELENGLHPTQAARMLELLVREGRKRQVQTLATTHSPALLSALAGEDHDGVYVCDREPGTGLSRIRPLPELDGYTVAMASGSLGDAVTKGLLAARDGHEPDHPEFERLLGLA